MMQKKSFSQPFCAVCMALILTLSGCLKSRIEGSGTPEAQCPRVTVWHSYYGFSWNDVPEKKSSNGIGLYQATVYRNFLYDLIPIVTLGLAVPVQYEYQLQQPPVAKNASVEEEMTSTRARKQ